jgi:hypothetical protein
MRNWWKLTGKYTVISPDAWLGAIVGVGLRFATHYAPSILGQGQPVLIAEMALGVALLAVCLTALSILVGFLGEDYLAFLKDSPLGIRGAIAPYKTVAAVSATQALCGLGSVLCWPIAPTWGKQISVAVTSGLASWAIVGIVQLVGITARHGFLRSRIPEIREAGLQALEARRKTG